MLFSHGHVFVFMTGLFTIYKLMKSAVQNPNLLRCTIRPKEFDDTKGLRDGGNLIGIPIIAALKSLS